MMGKAVRSSSSRTRAAGTKRAASAAPLDRAAHKAVAERRRKRRADVARHDIIDAAALVFAQRGYHESTMQDIAQCADVPAASIYTYFKGKQAIHDAIVELVLAELELVFTPQRSGDLNEKIRGYVAASFRLFEQHRHALFYLIARPMPGAASMAESSTTYVPRIEQWLRQSDCVGHLGSWSTAEAAVLIWSVTRGAAEIWLVAEGAEDVQMTVARTTRAIVGALKA